MIRFLICLAIKNLKNPIVTELFIKARKLNISLVFITRSYFDMPKNIRLNPKQDSIMKISNKQKLQQTEFNHSSDIDFKGFMNLYDKCTAKPYYFLFIDATLVSDILLASERIF